MVIKKMSKKKGDSSNAKLNFFKGKQRRVQKSAAKISKRGLESTKSVSKGVCFLACVEKGAVSRRQLEAARKGIKRVIKKSGFLDVRAFAYVPLTKKPSEVRMGKGKGTKINEWVYPIRPGKVIFEIKNLQDSIAKKALQAASLKFSLSTRVLFAKK